MVLYYKYSSSHLLANSNSLLVVFCLNIMIKKHTIRLSRFYSNFTEKQINYIFRTSAFNPENRYDALIKEFPNFTFYSASEDFHLDLKRASKEASHIARTINNYGADSYYIGGVTRDSLLNKKFKDVDLATTLVPEEIKDIFLRRCRVIGRRFVLCHVHGGNQVFDVATFRTSKNLPVDPDNPKNGLISQENFYSQRIADDVHRRDFTVNALYYNFKEDHILDFFNGIEDLQKRVLKSIGDPLIRLREDPIRIIRAIRQAARTDFTIEKNLARAILTHRELVTKVSTSRLADEIIKTLSIDSASKSLVNIVKYNLLPVLFPEVAPAINTEIINPSELSALPPIKSSIVQAINKEFAKYKPILRANLVDSSFLQANSPTLLQMLAGCLVTELRFSLNQPINFAFVLANIRAPRFINQVLQINNLQKLGRRRINNEINKLAIASFSTKFMPSVYKRDQEAALEILNYLGLMVAIPAVDQDRVKMAEPMCRAAFSILKIMMQIFDFNSAEIEKFKS